MGISHHAIASTPSPFVRSARFHTMLRQADPLLRTVDEGLVLPDRHLRLEVVDQARAAANAWSRWAAPAATTTARSPICSGPVRW